jgi:hypothetical protein
MNWDTPAVVHDVEHVENASILKKDCRKLRFKVMLREPLFAISLGLVHNTQAQYMAKRDSYVQHPTTIANILE